MSKGNLYEKLHILLFRWINLYQKYWSKQQRYTRNHKKNILIYCVGYVTTNMWNEDSNGNEYLTLVPTEKFGAKLKTLLDQ